MLFDDAAASGSAEMLTTREDVGCIDAFKCVLSINAPAADAPHFAIVASRSTCAWCLRPRVVVELVLFEYYGSADNRESAQTATILSPRCSWVSPRQ